MIKRGGIILALAALFHFATVWLIPRAITTVFMHRVAERAGYNNVVLPPSPTDKSRDVVKPSPDLLYAVCVFDLSRGPVRIAATPPKSYWSIALYARNSDNFFKMNEREAKGTPIELILASAGGGDALAAAHPGAVLVRPPGEVGVMLTRSLVANPETMKDVLDARANTHCEALNE